MDKRGPYRKVLQVERVGKHGASRYLLNLECGHVRKALRKPPRERVCCSECGIPVSVEDEIVVDMDPIRDAAKLAHRLGVDVSQVSVYPGGAQVTMDTFQLRKLLY